MFVFRIPFKEDTEYFAILGVWDSGSCLFGVEDVQRLLKRPELLVHKLDLAYYPAAYFCLAETIRNRTYRQTEFNTTFYEQIASGVR